MNDEMDRIINLRVKYSLCGVPKENYMGTDFAEEMRLKEITKRNREYEERKKTIRKGTDAVEELLKLW